MGLNKEQSRKRIHLRIRKKIQGTAEKPRLAVYRSNKQIYAQLIDDVKGHTIASANSKEAGATGPKVDQSKAVGKLIAEKASAQNINSVVFDRGGYLYHGRVKAVAEGAREAGLVF